MTRDSLRSLRRPVLSAGMLTADLGRLGDELAEIERAGVQMVHVDVMDGRFCPTLTVGAPVVAAMRTSMLIDVHLMVEDPVAHVDAFVAAGADLITLQVEATRHVHRALQRIGEAGTVARGVALAPSTAVVAVEPLLEVTDLVLVLAVNPGWPGQRFLPATVDRVAAVRRLVVDSGCDVLVGVDGGVTQSNASDVAATTKADLVVAGRAIFDGTRQVASNATALLAALRDPS